MSEQFEKDDIIEDLLEIQNKKDSIRKTYRDTGKLFKRFESERQRRKRIMLIGGISAVACIAIFLIILVPSFNRLSGDEIFDRYYQRYELSHETRSTNDQDDIIEVYELYHSGQGQEAMEKLESIDYENPDAPEYVFYKALILMDLGDYEKAEGGFAKLIDLGGSYKWNALWYSALIDLRNHDNKSAIVKLKELNNAPMEFRKKARRLRKLISRNSNI